ncbi:glycoside hydrolase family 19 protein [Polaromonas sp. P2-4]|nr:glycoside hydrolase family 19 protein [Polaromonas sp. P2-4]
MRRTNVEWLKILNLCGVKARTAALWSPIFSEVIGPGTFSADDDEIDDFLGQVLHESAMLERLEEGLYYKTPGRLMATWPTRFKSLAEEVPYLRNPEALANKVYGGRMGNNLMGDGWRNRGSGLIQITGADNLKAVQAATGIPVYDRPELLRKPTAEALRVVIAWWEGNVPDSAMGNIKKTTGAVNGGQIGLADRKQLTDEAGEALA